MEDGEDFVMSGGLGSEALTSEDFQPVEECNGFCLLCEYGTTPGTDTPANVNADIKALEEMVQQIRKGMGIKRAAMAIHQYYVDNLRGLAPFDVDEFWTLECVEDHLARHAAPEAVARGERPGEDMAYEVFSNALHAQSKVLVNKETGLLDEKQVKIACQLADRMYKFMPKARTDVGTVKGKTNNNNDFY